MVKTYSNKYKFFINSSSDCCVDIHFSNATTVKKADKIFLLPFEKHMSQFMRHAILYSYFARILIQLIIVIVMFPLFYNINQHNVAFYICFGFSALIFPYVGLRLRWQWYQSGLKTWQVNLISFIIFALTYYLLLAPKWYIVFVMVALPVLIEFLVKKYKPGFCILGRK